MKVLSPIALATVVAASSSAYAQPPIAAGDAQLTFSGSISQTQQSVDPSILNLNNPFGGGTSSSTTTTDVISAYVGYGYFLTAEHEIGIDAAISHSWVNGGFTDRAPVSFLGLFYNYNLVSDDPLVPFIGVGGYTEIRTGQQLLDTSGFDLHGGAHYFVNPNISLDATAIASRDTRYTRNSSRYGLYFGFSWFVH